MTKAERVALWKAWSYEFENWMGRFMSAPTKLIISKDVSQPWEMDIAHIFKLENGQFAVVIEEGCSCYSSSDAKIELFPNKDRAMKAFKKWEECQ